MREHFGELLLERESELAALAKRIDEAVEGRGGLVVIEGEPGIGKTRLTEALIASAVDMPIEVLSARAGEFEQDYPFGIVRQLYERQIALADATGREALFVEAAGVTRPIFDHRESDTGSGSLDEASFGVLHGLYWLTANLADRAPLLIVVDDAHWADAPTLRFLSFLAKRITELPALVVVTTRPIETAAESGLLEEIAADPATAVLHPTPLSEAAVAEIVRAQLTPEINDDVCAACHEATRGNPYLLRELLRSVRESAASPDSITAAKIADLAPSSVARAVAHRLAQLPPEASTLSHAVVVLGGASELSTACELVDLEPRAALEAADTLAHAEILRRQPQLEFVHPIVREAIDSQIPSERRNALHLEAARLLDRAGAPAHEIATHLLATAPGSEPWATATLRRAARSAMDSGAPDLAAGFLRRGLEESISGNDRAELLIELGVAEAADGTASCFDRFEQAFEIANDRMLRVEAARMLARCRWKQSSFKEAFEAFGLALDTLDNADPELASRLEAECIGAGAFDLPTFPSTVERMAPFMQRYQRGELTDPVALAGLSMMVMAGVPPAANGVRLAKRAIAAHEEMQLPTSDEYAMLYVYSWLTLIVGGELEFTRHSCDRVLSELRGTGDLISIAMVTCLRGHIDLRTGDLVSSQGHAQAGFDLASSRGLRTAEPIAIGVLGWSMLEQGNIEDAAKVINLPADPLPEELHFNFVLYVRGRVRAEQGDLEGGLRDLREAGRRATGWGVRNPAIFAWRGAAALILDRLGDHDEARRLADEEVELARLFKVDASTGAALRVAGLVRGGDAGLAMLREAVTTLESSPAKLDLALAKCDLGAALRRAGSRVEAREPLRDALDLAHRCGAASLAERAHQELLAAGARPRRLELSGVESLTPSERRVADLAASGRTNREIAQELFVTEKTVEHHLSQAYRKLDIGSRSELAGTLSA